MSIVKNYRDDVGNVASIATDKGVIAYRLVITDKNGVMTFKGLYLSEGGARAAMRRQMDKTTIREA